MFDNCYTYLEKFPFAFGSQLQIWVLRINYQDLFNPTPPPSPSTSHMSASMLDTKDKLRNETVPALSCSLMGDRNVYLLSSAGTCVTAKVWQNKEVRVIPSWLGGRIRIIRKDFPKVMVLNYDW